MPAPRRDFFLQTGFPDLEIPEDARYLLWAQPNVVQLYGVEFAREVVEALKASREARGVLFRRMRTAWWALRNGSKKKSCYAPRAVEVMQSLQFLELAGFSRRDLRALVECMSHGCTCDGCDLLDGRRFDRPVEGA